MRKLSLTKLDGRLQAAVRELLPLYRAVEDESGIAVEFGRADTLKVEATAHAVKISCPFPAAFFRGLMLFFLHRQEKACFTVEETVQIPECGVMLDLSRNAVMRLDALKEYIRNMAVMGLNVLHLYMEDVYPLPGHPYFGYMRGRYTADELREADRYALQFGIEVVPNIQTLGHMEQYIKWNEGTPYRDTERVLIAGQEHTYQLIDDMLGSLSRIFTSRRVHLGMDEAGDLGSGGFYAKNGHVPRTEILLSHLKRVLQIADKYGMEAIIYGDTLYATLSGSQYASGLCRIPPEVKAQIDGKLTLVYWDYYTTEQAEYEKMLQGYQDITKNLIFWGGIWTWFGFLPDNRFTWETTTPALSACKALGVRSVVGSMWGDNGCECSHFLGMWGMQLFAEHMYHSTVSEAHLKKHFEFFTGGDHEAFVRMSDFHNAFASGQKFDHYWDRYFGKRYLWSDILLGLMDKALEQRPMAEHYESLAAELRQYAHQNPRWEAWYCYAAELTQLLAKKCYISERLKKAYDENNRTFLTECVQTLLPELQQKYRHMRNVHKQQWLETYKSFGWEVLDIRYGGMEGRVRYAQERITDYLNGTVNRLEELEEERLPHDIGWTQKDFSSIATACMKI